MLLLDFMKKPVRVLLFLGGFGAILTLFPLLGAQITHLEIAVTGLALGVFALVSGGVGMGSGLNQWRKPAGGSEELKQAVFALPVIVTAGILLVLGAQAAYALKQDAPPHHAKSGEPAMQLGKHRLVTERWMPSRASRGFIGSHHGIQVRFIVASQAGAPWSSWNLV